MFLLIVSLPASAWITSRLAASAARARVAPMAKKTAAAARERLLIFVIVRLRASGRVRNRDNGTGREADGRQVSADCHRARALSQLRCRAIPAPSRDPFSHLQTIADRYPGSLVVQ